MDPGSWMNTRRLSTTRSYTSRNTANGPRPAGGCVRRTWCRDGKCRPRWFCLCDVEIGTDLERTPHAVRSAGRVVSPFNPNLGCAQAPPVFSAQGSLAAFSVWPVSRVITGLCGADPFCRLRFVARLPRGLAHRERDTSCPDAGGN